MSARLYVILMQDDPRLITAPTKTMVKVTLLMSLFALFCVKFKKVWTPVDLA